jgi:GH15 family glucan-1,4-alpha-glucosidase
MPDLAHDLSIMPPFSTMQISSEAFRKACLEMAKSSFGDARLILNLGHHSTLGNDRNWVIRWLSWHARLKDPPAMRHTRESQVCAEASSEVSKEIVTEYILGVATSCTDKVDETHCTEGQRIYWDPARDV